MRERRWMLFVDGENLAIRAAAFAQAHGVALSEGPYCKKDVFIWMPGLSATHVLTQPQKGNKLEKYAARAHYYTSLVGSDETILDVRKGCERLVSNHSFSRGHPPRRNRRALTSH